MTTTSGPRVRVLRGLEPKPADLGTVSARAARDLVVDPVLVQEATESGYRAGYDAGFTAGLEDAASAIESRERTRHDELTRVLADLAHAADSLAAEHAAIVADIEDRLIEIACAVARQVVGRELAHTDDRARDALRRALQLAPEQGPVRARLHPDDIATAGDLTALTHGRALTIVEDASLRPGDCIVDVDATRIDARIVPAFERIRAVLEGEMG